MPSESQNENGFNASIRSSQQINMKEIQSKVQIRFVAESFEGRLINTI
jgi:hypothetical protein